ncbi:TlpA family protein disulfide reductase [Pedobacter punctiformis]|uniref:TlpA disulfide reductase family protein n=1 Tax=Pedobacter punctiformis TaxID=3004097 RepID=A0ABT4L5I3_9SPHI|nr:TlpA disulfide reductase family protein [Pedobacter sp. HCMS5-2]MCZ4243180.1 TlpA disulfide reductase family protein [Pedobacter sp. HCMS5-2]
MNITRNLTLILLALISLGANAQAPAEITGVFKRTRKSAIKLFSVVEGKTQEIASSQTNSLGQFGFKFYPEYEGLYVLGTGNALSAADNYKFYFKPGDKLNLVLNDSTYTLSGILNSKENTVLTQWHNLAYSVERKSINFMKVNSTYVDFFPELETLAAKSKTFLNGKATGNKKFDQQIKSTMQMDMTSYATSFLNTPRSAHPSVEEYSDYYAGLNTAGLSKNTSLIYNYPWGIRTLSSIISVELRKNNVKYVPGLEWVKIQTNLVPNDTLKGDLILETAERYKAFADYKLLKETYGKYILTKSQQKKDLDILTPLALLKEGDQGLNFSYPDKNGKTVTLADLKGKVVLVDVWATWCGPCKVEIPHLKKLEEEMKGKDVQIVSISVDDVKDKAKWLKMIEEENLGGMQLFASASNDISKYYKINGIPRFMVFDKEGKIVTVDSPRPSQPALKALLEKTLNK